MFGLNSGPYYVHIFGILKLEGYVLPAALGSIIVFRCLYKREVEDDKATFRVWNLWVTMIYLLPLVKRVEQVM